MVDEAADDHRAEAAHRREREVELGDGEGHAEADAENGEEAHLLQHVEQVGRIEEIGCGDGEESEEQQRRDRGAVGGDDPARIDPSHT